MMNDVAISLKNVSKYYKLYSSPRDRLKEALSFTGKTYHKKFYATKNISFELKKGEMLGVLGRNGSGKSTLLKLITNILKPDEGSVEVNGKISALLELGSGFNPQFTGMQNIFFYGTILGFTKEEMEEKLNDILTFADIGDFINQPLKTYSSGMKSRLGFAVAAHLNTEILILDEVLAVGDFVFRQKCLAKINEIRETTSIILVSHSMNDIKVFCDKAIVLKNGALVFEGTTDNAIDFYHKDQEKQIEEKKQEEKKPIKEKHKHVPKKKEMKTSSKPFYGDMFHNENKITDVKHIWDKNIYRLNEEMQFEFEFVLNFRPRNLIIGLPVWDKSGNLITSFNTDYYDIEFDKNTTKISAKLVSACAFNPGEYTSAIAITDGSEFVYRQLNNVFKVSNKERVFGFVTLEHQWIINE